MRRIISLALALAILLSLGAVGGVTAFAASEMKASDQVIDFIKAYEGFSKYPYEDYGQDTIGYGTRCPADKLEEYKANGITEEAAEELLREFIGKFEVSVNYFIDQNGLTLTQNQFDALLSYSYNVGGNWVHSTKTNFYKTLSKPNPVPEEVLYWLAVYSFAGGNTYLSALTGRRLTEANMFNNGVYSRIRPENYCYVLLRGNGGEVSYTVCAYDTNSDVRVYPTVTRSGYSFAGWYTEANGGTKVEAFDASMNGKELFAHWTDGEGNDVNMGGITAGGNTSEAPLGEELKEPVTVKVTNNGVNLRKGPGTNYTTIGTANKGKELTISRVAVGGAYTWGYYGQGWIALKYTNYQTVISGNEDKVEEQPEDTNKILTGTVKVNNYLRIRSGAGTGYSETGRLYNNDKVTITETKQVGSVTWGKIDKGWISLQYVVLDEVTSEPEEPSKPEEETKPSEPEATEPTEPEPTEPAPTEPEETKPEEDKQPETTGVKVTVTNNGVNLRKGPGTNYTTVGTANKGDQLTITETKQGGAYLWGNYGNGWIALKYTSYESTTGGEANDDTTTETPDTPAKIMGTVKVSSSLSIRKDAGTGYERVGSYKNGDRVEILEQKAVGSATWGKTNKGWISLQYVVLDGASNDNTATDNDTTTDNGSADNNDSATGATSVTGTVKVNDYLRIRSGAGTSYACVGYYYSNAKVTITEQKQVGAVTWGKTDRGWISMEYVALDGENNNSTAAPAGDVKTITASCLRVRKDADLSSTVVGYLYYGTKVTILETKTVGDTTWGRIANGWISMEYAQ